MAAAEEKLEEILKEKNSDIESSAECILENQEFDPVQNYNTRQQRAKAVDHKKPGYFTDSDDELPNDQGGVASTSTGSKASPSIISQSIQKQKVFLAASACMLSTLFDANTNN